MRNVLLVASVGLAATLIGAAGAAPKPQDWPQGYFDSGHSGYNPHESVLSRANVSQLHRKWKQKLPANVVAYALYDGILYAQTQDAGRGQRHLIALNASTGGVFWNTATGNDLLQDLYRFIAVTKQMVFAPCGVPATQTKPAGGGICAYHRDNGKQAWSFFDTTEESPGFLISGPVYSNNTVYVAAGRVYNSGQNNVGDVVALNAKTGVVRWAVALPSIHAGINGGPMAADANHVYVPFTCLYPDEVTCPTDRFFGGVFALSVADGSLSWSSNLGTADAGLSVGKTAIYANTNTRCVNGDDLMHEIAIDPATGQQLWDVPLSGAAGGCNRSISPVGGDFVYASGVDGLHALNTESHAQKWLGAGYGTPIMGASVANGLIYTWANNGGGDKLSALNTKNGHVLWTLETPRALEIAPIIADGVLYVTGADCGSICAYSLP